MNIFCRREVSHSCLERFMAHPVLYSPHVEARPEHPCGISRPESLQIEFFLSQFSPLRDGFALVEQVVFPIASRGGEYKTAPGSPRMPLERV